VGGGEKVKVWKNLPRTVQRVLKDAKHEKVGGARRRKGGGGSGNLIREGGKGPKMQKIAFCLPKGLGGGGGHKKLEMWRVGGDKNQDSRTGGSNAERG